MKESIFYARRTDGLGERLRALLNAIALSKVYSAEYKFTWKSNLAGSMFHTTETAERVFSSTYLASHCVEPSDIGEIQNVTSFLEKKNPGGYFCDQTIPAHKTSFATNKSEIQAFDDELKNAFWEIEFSESFNSAIQAANSIKINDSTVALHLRAGDLIYDRFKHTVSYLGKAMPFPVAEKIIEYAKDMGWKVLIFGQDRILERYLKKKWNVDFASDLMPLDIEKAEASIFDVILMSRCRKLYAGNSGFSVLSSIISKGEYIHYFNFLNSDQRVELICDALLNNHCDEGIPGPQIAYACKAALVEGYKELNDSDFEKLAFLGKKSDEDTIFFDFIIAWKAYWSGNYEEGDKLILKLMEEDKINFVSFIKNNTGSPHQRKFFIRLFDPKVLKNRGESTASGKLKILMSKFI